MCSIFKLIISSICTERAHTKKSFQDKIDTKVKDNVCQRWRKVKQKFNISETWWSLWSFPCQTCRRQFKNGPSNARLMYFVLIICDLIRSLVLGRKSSSPHVGSVNDHLWYPTDVYVCWYVAVYGFWTSILPAMRSPNTATSRPVFGAWAMEKCVPWSSTDRARMEQKHLRGRWLVHSQLQ